jgi:hypothetical protein
VVLAAFARRVLEPLLCLPPTVDGVAERFGAIGVTNERGNERLAVAPGVDCSYRNATQTRFGDCPAQRLARAVGTVDSNNYGRGLPRLFAAAHVLTRDRWDRSWTLPPYARPGVRWGERRGAWAVAAAGSSCS